MVHLMRSDGFQCLEAGNGLEALEQLRAVPGRRSCSAICACRRWTASSCCARSALVSRISAVVMITAVADVEIAVSCLAIGPRTTSSSRISSRRCGRASPGDGKAAADPREPRVPGRASRSASRSRRGGSRSCSSPACNRSPRRSSQGPVHARPFGAREPLFRRRSRAALGLAGEMLRQIELGGHVHDIGKIGVRESVLNKAGRLTAEEYQHIMTHPSLGWRILAPLARRDAARPQHRAVAPRAIRWSRRPRRSQGRRDSARGADRGRGRRARRHDQRSPVSRRAGCTLDSRGRRDASAARTQFDPEVVDALVPAADAGETGARRRTTRRRREPVSVPRCARAGSPRLRA